MIDNREVLNRLKIMLGIREDKALAEALGISQPALSMWRKRNKIDMQLVIDRFPKADLNWLIRGGESKGKITFSELETNPSRSNAGKEPEKSSIDEAITLRLENSRLQGQVDLLKEQLDSKELELRDCLQKLSVSSAQLMLNKKNAESQECLQHPTGRGARHSVFSNHSREKGS